MKSQTSCGMWKTCLAVVVVLLLPMVRSRTIVLLIVIVVLLVVAGLGIYYATRPVTPALPPEEPGPTVASERQPPTRPLESEPPSAASPHVFGSHDSPPAALVICSFNVKWIGYYAERDDDALADILKDCDIVVIQELVSPPYQGNFPDGKPYKPDLESREFFDAMHSQGFEYLLSEEDTGTGDTIHTNSSSTEWFVAFYHPGRVDVANDLPSGFLDADRSNHPDYERVPYAFAFRSMDGKLDFVLISVHLKPDAGPANRARRKHELGAIAAWIDARDGTEKDFVILGDMNIGSEAELASATPCGTRSAPGAGRRVDASRAGHIAVARQSARIARTSGRTGCGLRPPRVWPDRKSNHFRESGKCDPDWNCTKEARNPKEREVKGAIVTATRIP